MAYIAQYYRHFNGVTPPLLRALESAHIRSLLLAGLERGR